MNHFIFYIILFFDVFSNFSVERFYNDILFNNVKYTLKKGSKTFNFLIIIRLFIWNGRMCLIIYDPPQKQHL